MNAGPGAVYLCYFPISDPLVESQVIAYLKGLARAGFRIHLITFELSDKRIEKDSIRAQLLSDGIDWSFLSYRPGGSLARKAWEGLRGVCRVARVVVQHRLAIIHARAHPPAMMAYPVARLLRRKILFDVRGLIADEYADIGRWSRSGGRFRGVKMAERFLLRHADALVFLTNAIVQDLVSRGTLRKTDLEKMSVIPCCVSIPEPLPPPTGEFTLAYVGKLGSWYLDEDALRLFLAIKTLRPRARFMMITQSPTEALRTRLKALGLSEDDVWIGAVAHPEVQGRLNGAHAAVAFYKPGYSKLATSPTKVGEYLAAGLPVVVNTGIGDCDQLVGQGGCGVLVKDFSDAEIERAAASLIQLAETPGISERCRTVARRELDLQNVGVARYRALYTRLSA